MKASGGPIGHSARFNDLADRPRRPPSPKSVFLPVLFAFAVAVTPEFNFLGIPKIRITDLLLPLMLISVLGDLSRRIRKRQSRPFPLAAIMLTILVWDLICLVFLGEANLRPGLFYLIKRANFFLICYLGYAFVTSADAYGRILRGILWSSPLLSLAVAWDTRAKMTSSELLTNEQMRASGIIAGQQAQTGLFIITVLSLTLATWPFSKNRLFSVVSVLLGVAALLLTGTKSVVICFSVAVLSLMFGPSRLRLPVPLLAVSLGVGWYFAPAAVRDRLLGLTPEVNQVFSAMTEDASLMPSAGSSSLANRVVNVQNAFSEYITASPLVGLGTGYKTLGLIDNFFVTEWVYHGIVGLLLYLLLLWQTFVLLWSIVKSASDPISRAAAHGILAGIVAMTVAGLSSESFYLIRPMEVQMLLVGLACGSRSLMVEKQ